MIRNSYGIPSGDSRYNGLMGTLVLDNIDAVSINAVISGVVPSGDSRRYDYDIALVGGKIPPFIAVFTDFAINPSGDSRQDSSDAYLNAIGINNYCNIAHAINPDYRGKLNVK